MSNPHSSYNPQYAAYDPYGNTSDNHQGFHSNNYPTHLTQAVENQHPTMPSNGARHPEQAPYYGNMSHLSIGVVPMHMPAMEPPMPQVFSPDFAASTCNATQEFTVNDTIDDVCGTQHTSNERYTQFIDDRYKTDADSFQNYAQAIGGSGDITYIYRHDSVMTSSDTSLSGASSSPSNISPSPSSPTCSSDMYNSDNSLEESAVKRDLLHGKRNAASRGNKPGNEARYRAKIKAGFMILMDAMQQYQIEIKSDTRKYEPQSKPDLQVEAAGAIRFLMAELKQAREAPQARS